MSKFSWFAASIRIALTLAASTFSFFIGQWYGVSILQSFINAGIAVFVTPLFIFTNLAQVGHGVTGRQYITGMPIGLFVSYALLLLGFAAFYMAGDNLSSPKGTMLLHLEALACFSAWLAGFLDWYAISQKSTYYESEFRRRHILKKQGCSDPQIERTIQKYRKMGMFGSK